MNETNGILLIALGKESYLKFAINMAISLLANGTTIPIALATTDNLASKIDGEIGKVFSSVIRLDPEYYTLNNKFNAGWCKINMDKFTPFDNTMYLDVDSLAINSLDSLMDLCLKLKGEVYSQGFGMFSTKKEKTWSCDWMPFENVIKNYIPDNSGEVLIPEINSSFFFFKSKSKVFELAREIMTKEVPKEDFGRNWGNS